ncbi:chemotaxis protein CheB [Pseudoxanthomonas winnipegensis]|uniref:chemotaxis protein CheB n=1 Tax=Pseudoxanthomonas winnipegensis TaxID=2480810 RepID=UPI001F263C2F|nr:chemotaxis protein CheB [Pseudoxanthomonas winnipegensis]
MSATEAALSAPRVVLLARPGAAREQLRGALLGAGARIALEDDPNSLDADTLAAIRPQVVLVALEPAIEDALARLEAVLADPALTVIYDEAALASAREGWDAQRWARHLRAKLHGHRDVLPPGAEIEPPQAPEPGRPPAPEQLHEGARLELHLDEAAGQSAALPVDPGLNVPTDALEASVDPIEGVDTQTASPSPVSWSLADVPDPQPGDRDPATLPPLELEDEAAGAQPADAFVIDLDNWTPPETPVRQALVDTPVLAPLEPAEPAAEASPVAVEAPPPPSRPSFGTLSLVEDFQVTVPEKRAPAEPPPLPPGFGDLNLELEALDPAHGVAADPQPKGEIVPGAVLLFAGIGGPDAVRRVLAELPDTLEQPVLVHLRLDGGRYDNLVRQIERVSPLPVSIPVAGMVARAGVVYVVPDDLSARATAGKVEFVAEAVDVTALLGGLPPYRTAVLLLSGADPAHAEPALMLAARGGLIGGQSLQGCYDWAASRALEAGGGDIAAPEELARRVAQHLGI